MRFICPILLFFTLLFGCHAPSNNSELELTDIIEDVKRKYAHNRWKAIFDGELGQKEPISQIEQVFG